MTWRQFLDAFADTLAVSAVFAVAAAGLLLWTGADRVPLSRARAVAVLVSALLGAGIATAFVHGYLGWSIFLAPFVGVVAGLVTMPLMLAIARAGRRVENRADDIADRGIDMLPGRRKDDP